jgi:transglutaminase-like putative cysteine protease
VTGGRRRAAPAVAIDADATGLVDPRTVEWPRVSRSAYVIQQEMTYRYDGPIHDLRHRLVVIPPPLHGDQERIGYRFTVESTSSDALHRTRRDAFGNVILDVEADRVEEAIAFRTAVRVIRRPAGAAHRLRASQVPPAYRRASALTRPDGALRSAARRLRELCHDPLSLAHATNEWVHATMRYGFGVTQVSTDAAEALAGGTGVCQDYAHIMLAVCRLCGLPARYVSGHLLGEGGTHAWVEVLLADEHTPSVAVAHAFDPTHGCVAGPGYLTVAVGRDYRDVAPTSGCYRSGFRGRLESRRRVGIVEVEYAA